MGEIPKSHSTSQLVLIPLLNEKYLTKMKILKSIVLGSEPKETGKIMSLCMFIVIINGYFLEGLIEHVIIDIITYTCIIVFFILLIYNLFKK